MKSDQSNVNALISLQAILPSLTAGFIIGLIEIILAVSFAALIFSGELAPYVVNGIGLGLIGATVGGIVIALHSSIRGVVGGNQDAPAAILAISSAAIVSGMSGGATLQEKFSTVVITIAITTLLTGLVFVGLGYFKLGRLVRFLPYPVIGGFLAGTGWLLLPGAIGLMTNTTELAILITPTAMIRWLPGLALALILFIAPRFSSHYLVLPSTIITAAILFHLIAWLSGYSLETLANQGWLLGPFPEQSLFQPLILTQLEGIKWSMVAQQIPNILTIILTSTFALLLNASGVGLAVKEEGDLDRDLQAAGLGNILSSLFAGFIGYQQLSLSVLNHRLGANNRLPGVVISALCGLTLFFGASILSVVPKLVVGGLLLYLGLAFLHEWIYEAWFTFPKLDYGIIVLIVIVIVTVGFLEGVAVGILAAIVLFVINYSRINIIRHVLTGAEYQSRATRPLLHQRILEQRGEQLQILELQGFIFFGTAQQLIERIQNRLADATQPTLRYLLIDFRLVTGIDSSVTLSFSKLQQIVDEQSLILILTELDKNIELQWRDELFNDRWLTFPDLEQGVSWCEEQIITQFKEAGLSARPLSFVELIIKQLRDNSPDEIRWVDYLQPGDRPATLPEIEKLHLYTQRLEVNTGEIILHKGQPVSGLYFVEDGQMIAQNQEKSGSIKIWRTLEKGTVVGEMGWYTNNPASTDVIASKPSVLLYLSGENIKQMEQETPELAAVIHRLIVASLAGKLAQTNRLVQALQQ